MGGAGRYGVGVGNQFGTPRRHDIRDLVYLQQRWRATVVVVAAQQTEPGSYTGTLYQTTGPAFDAVPFDSAIVRHIRVGMATFRFFDGNSAAFTYTINTTAGYVTQSKQITREAFALPRTVCQ